MSFTACRAIADNDAPNPTAKFVLYVLADIADEDGLVTKASYERICKRTMLGRSTVIGKIGELERAGWLTRVSQGGGRKANVWQIDMARGVQQVDPSTGEGSSTWTPGVQEVDPRGTAGGPVPISTDPRTHHHPGTEVEISSVEVEATLAEVVPLPTGIPTRTLPGQDGLFQSIRLAAKQQGTWLTSESRKLDPLDYFAHAALLVRENHDDEQTRMRCYIQLLWEWLVHLDPYVEYERTRKFNHLAARFIGKHGPPTALRAVQAAIDSGAGTKDDYVGKADAIIAYAQRVLDTERNGRTA